MCIDCDQQRVFVTDLEPDDVHEEIQQPVAQEEIHGDNVHGEGDRGAT